MSAFIKLRRGLEKHLVRGRLGFLELGVYTTLHLQADYRTGIWVGSAPRLLATAPRGTDLRAVQRAVQRLVEIEFIRTFHIPGARGNYHCLIHKYEPSFGALKGMRLNALRSVSWQSPVYELCAEHDAEHDAEDAPSLDLRSKKEKKQEKTLAPKPAARVDSRHRPAFESCYDAYLEKFRLAPTWAGREGKALQRFLNEHFSVTAEEIARRFGFLLASTDRYHVEKHGSLVHLLSNFDAFTDGPILERSKPHVSDYAGKTSNVETTLAGYNQLRQTRVD